MPGPDVVRIPVMRKCAPKNLVQMFLLSPKILAFACLRSPSSRGKTSKLAPVLEIPIAVCQCRGIAYRFFSCQRGSPLPGGKINDLKIVLIGSRK